MRLSSCVNYLRGYTSSCPSPHNCLATTTLHPASQKITSGTHTPNTSGSNITTSGNWSQLVMSWSHTWGQKTTLQTFLQSLWPVWTSTACSTTLVFAPARRSPNSASRREEECPPFIPFQFLFHFPPSIYPIYPTSLLTSTASSTHHYGSCLVNLVPHHVSVEEECQDRCQSVSGDADLMGHMWLSWGL